MNGNLIEDQCYQGDLKCNDIIGLESDARNAAKCKCYAEPRIWQRLGGCPRSPLARTGEAKGRRHHLNPIKASKRKLR